MRVTLGYAWAGHQPDTTIEVDDVVGRMLLHSGKARRPDVEDAPPLDYMTVSQLRAYASDHEIDIPSDVRKRVEIADVIRTALQARASHPEGTPANGDDHQEATDVR